MSKMTLVLSANSVATFFHQVWKSAGVLMISLLLELIRIGLLIRYMRGTYNRP